MAGSGSDVILAGAGNDVIYAGFGADPDDPFADGLWWPGPAVPEGDLPDRLTGKAAAPNIHGG
ncbi:MAG: hypothetical protein JKP98_05655 [Rhodobacteraceae bacterium]|nr:hypothetical protein [Paracoccaceae bacterium]